MVMFMATIKFISKHRPLGGYVFPHAHNSYEFVCYSNGNLKSTIGGEIHRFSAGDIVIIPPHTIHDEKHYASTTMFFCTFEPNDIEPCFKLFYTAEELSSTRVPQLIDLINKEITEGAMNHDKLIELFFSEILVELSRISGNKDSSPVYVKKVVEYACDFFKDNLSRPIDIPTLAAQTGYSYDRFRHIFTQHIGCPPYKYLTEVRVQAAKHLCKTTNNKFTVIAKECGFSTPSRMIQAFKAETGLTPSEYRAKIKSLETIKSLD